MDSGGQARTKAAAWLGAGLLLAAAGIDAQAQRPVSRARSITAVIPTKNTSDNIQQLFASAQNAADQNRFDEAVRIYASIISLSAGSPKNAALAQSKIGSAYMAQRKFANAVVAFQRSLSLNPTDAEAQNNLGEAFGELKQYARAIEAFTKAAGIDAALLRARYNQGVTYGRMGNARYAEFVFRNLMKSSPNYALAYDGLAVTLSRSGRAKEAIAYHEKAIALNPDDPSFYYNLAISYLILGNTEKALAQQEKLKAIDPMIADRLASAIVKHQM
ncbi:MAG: tetratricopeptide repeat protein [bacterium]